MPEISVKEFLDCTLRSGLVSEEQLRCELDKLKSSGGSAIRNTRGMADHLIAERLITKWQADQLQRRRYRGFNLGNYRLMDQLGRGGMSVVYVGKHLRMHRKVAIKVLPRSRVKNKAYLDRFLTEARAAAALSHPNIVRAYDFDSDGDTYFLVMECLEGQTLSQLVQSAHPLQISAVVSYISQAAAGLQHAHSKGLVHRDIKPANLMITKEGQAKVLDMGLARLSQAAEDSSLTDGSGAGIMGTADYLAPEQALNSHDVDQRADVYGLGCTLYFALTGQPPFPDGTMAEKIASHQHKGPESPLSLRAECPTALARLCRVMMAKNPAARIASMDEVVRQMSKVEIFGLPEATTTSVGGLPEMLAADSMEVRTEKSHIPDVEVVEEFTLASGERNAVARKRGRRRRSVPIWLWLAMVALIAAAIWLATKIGAQGGLRL